MQLQGATHVHWAAAASDPSKLRSLLLNPAQYPGVRLVEQHHTTFERATPSSATDSTYAYSHEVLPHGQGIRCTIYGNLRAIKPDYHHAAQQIVAMQPVLCKLSALPAAAVQHVRDVFCNGGYREVSHNPCWQYVVAESCLLQLLLEHQLLTKQLSAQYHISTLQRAEAALVDGLWTFRSPSSQVLIEQLIADRQTACVRTAAGQPVAWAVEVEPGCAGMLHTREGHRRKGLGRWVLATLLCKLQQQHEQQEDEALMLRARVLGSINHSINGSSGDIASCWPGGNVYCYVVQDNVASVQLLESLGLTRTGVFVWMAFNKAPSY